MYSRLNHEVSPVLFPDKWTAELKQILLNIYGEQCIKEDRTFEVYGLTYPTEAMLVLSYVSLDKFVHPITLSLSADLNDSAKADKVMDKMFDAAGVFFDQFFANMREIDGDEDQTFEDYVLDWEEAEFANEKFYYMVSRENVGLSLAADALLGE